MWLCRSQRACSAKKFLPRAGGSQSGRTGLDAAEELRSFRGARGRQAEFRTRVHGNGNLLIGHAYTRRLGLEPGQEFKIELHRDSGAIWLLPLEQNVADREQDGSGQLHP